MPRHFAVCLYEIVLCCARAQEDEVREFGRAKIAERTQILRQPDMTAVLEGLCSPFPPPVDLFDKGAEGTSRTSDMNIEATFDAVTTKGLWWGPGGA